MGTLNGLRGSFGTPLLSFSVYSALFVCLYMCLQTDSRTLGQCAISNLLCVVCTGKFASGVSKGDELVVNIPLSGMHYLETYTVYSVYTLI